VEARRIAVLRGHRPVTNPTTAGYHPQNNPESAGGPETVMVGEVRAPSKFHALEKAFHEGIRSHPSQTAWDEEQREERKRGLSGA
jgi:hypothetical protein